MPLFVDTPSWPLVSKTLRVTALLAATYLCSHLQLPDPEAIPDLAAPPVAHVRHGSRSQQMPHSV